jgi:signal transduction histidine kinase
MRSSRTWLVWAAFALCAVTILGAMAWQTRNAMASERERISAVRQADLQEKMRLALWRMDTMGADLLLEEGLGGPAEFIRARFVWRDNGQLTQPDGSPASGELQRAIIQPGESFERYFIRVGNTSSTWKSIPSGTKASLDEARAPAPGSEDAQKIANKLELERRRRVVDGANMRQKAIIEEIAQAPKKAPLRKAASRKAMEAELADAAADAVQQPSPSAPVELSPAAEVTAPPAEPSPDPPPVAPQPMETISATKPVWIGDELFLLRSVSGPQRSITGSWIRLDALQARLLGEIRDLLPAARLIPAKAPSSDGLVLASLPLRLEPGPLDFRSMPATAAPAVLLSLATGWAAALLAILAASLLVFGIMRLSERRASFVSAVTHELRTPLTTFRLYSDMLESNAVKPEKRGDYLRVLSREADRLSHLVENVLAFSRIERGSARSAVTSSRVGDLLSAMRERFDARLATAGMTLHMPLDEPSASETLRADSTAIEHILFNLVDNAAKYAASGTPAILNISVIRNLRSLEIHVTDHGPGIPIQEQRRIFRAFHKSARQAAESCPGVGLGLALSRRLARSMGGDLTCKSTPVQGTTFVLSLPA